MSDKKVLVQTAYVQEFPDPLSFYQYGKFKLRKIAQSAQKEIPGVDDTALKTLFSSVERLIRVAKYPEHDTSKIVQSLLGNDVVLKTEVDAGPSTTSEDAVRYSGNEDAASAVTVLEPLYLCILKIEVDEESNNVKLSAEAENMLEAMRNSKISNPVYLYDCIGQRKDESLKQNIHEITGERAKSVLSSSEIETSNILANILKGKLRNGFEEMVDILKSRKISLSRNWDLEEKTRTQISQQIEDHTKSISDMISLFTRRKKKNEMTDELRDKLHRYKERGLTAYVYCFGKMNVYVSELASDQTKSGLRDLLMPHFDNIEVLETNADSMIRPLAACPGSQICRANENRTGTLGCFGTLGNPQSLVAITAFHVIPLNQKAYIRLVPDENIPVGRCLLGYQPPVERVNLSDIGVIEIYEESKNLCNQSNLDKQGNERSLVLNTSPSPSLESKYVFKRGGSTKLTCGYIISNEAAHYLNNSPCEMIVIEGDDANDVTPFAEEGDCGSIVIWHPMGSGSMYAVSVINGCIDSLQNLPKGSTISARMDSAIQKCNSRLQRNLNIV